MMSVINPTNSVVTEQQTEAEKQYKLQKKQIVGLNIYISVLFSLHSVDEAVIINQAGGPGWKLKNMMSQRLLKLLHDYVVMLLTSLFIFSFFFFLLLKF